METLKKLQHTEKANKLKAVLPYRHGKDVFSDFFGLPVDDLAFFRGEGDPVQEYLLL